MKIEHKSIKYMRHASSDNLNVRCVGNRGR